MRLLAPIDNEFVVSYTTKADATPVPQSADMNDNDRQFLIELAQAAIDSARLEPGASALDPEGKPTGRPNTLDFAIIPPGGRAHYPALWVEEIPYSFATGLVPVEEGLNHLRLIAACQNGPEWRALDGAAALWPYAVPDHVNFDGTAVFFPGTYSPDADQGGEPYGVRPPASNHYDFIWLAWLLVRHTGSPELLREEFSDVPLLDRLRRAFDAVPAETDTGLVATTAEERFVGFLFCDAIYMTGRLLTASLLRHRAAGHLADLYALVGREDHAEAMRDVARQIEQNVPTAFTPRPGRGWLPASTGVSNQDDVWGTIYALWRRVLVGPPAQKAYRQILRALDDGTILYEGAVRHVPLDGDASETSAWEHTEVPYNRYMNGAYWHVPTGWLIDLLSREDPDRARVVLDAYVAHMREHDFRRGPELGGPWECIGPEKEAWKCPVFLGSITMPLGVLAAEWWRESA